MKIKQIVSKNIKLAVFVFLSVFSISFIVTDVAYADTATDTCKGIGYAGLNLAACEYGYRNPATGKTDQQLNDACSSAGYRDQARDQAACRVGANLPSNTKLATDAESACASVGYYGSFKDNCVKSYNENAGKSDADLEKACGGKNNTCYVAGKLKTTNTSTTPNTKAACESAGGTWNVDTVNPSTGQPSYKCKSGSNTVPPNGAPVNPTPANPTNGNPTNANNGSGGECGGAQTSILTCSGTGQTAIIEILVVILQIMTVGVGILAVGGIVYGAILYASAQDNAGQTKKAVEVITNTVIGLLLYLFMYAILNLLIPGGVFNP
ncbi:MAG: hypothetical protein EOP54_16905 [Sphingobacteriales bacterium]|nr:MAG: hypothetical protein EOP54_16905 [Sphingobacteriales bacterium]